uniref:Uncharacterized protein n=1 Tax=Zea mays TaxID=4577 RepID=A0A804N706_MAIZE
MPPSSSPFELPHHHAMTMTPSHVSLPPSLPFTANQVTTQPEARSDMGREKRRMGRERWCPTPSPSNCCRTQPPSSLAPPSTIPQPLEPSLAMASCPLYLRQAPPRQEDEDPNVVGCLSAKPTVEALHSYGRAQLQPHRGPHPLPCEHCGVCLCSSSSSLTIPPSGVWSVQDVVLKHGKTTNASLVYVYVSASGVFFFKNLSVYCVAREGVTLYPYK